MLHQFFDCRERLRRHDKLDSRGLVKPYDSVLLLGTVISDAAFVHGAGYAGWTNGFREVQCLQFPYGRAVCGGRNTARFGTIYDSLGSAHCISAD
jgi:hypothetical protein